MKKFIYILLLFVGLNSYAQKSILEFKENKGQWNKKVLFKADIPGGNLYLERNKLTYLFYNEDDYVRLGDLHHGYKKVTKPSDEILRLHAFNVEFLGGNSNFLTPEQPSKSYDNYYLGNDKSKWASKVKKYEKVTYSNLYKGIDLTYYLKEGFIKYDFIVSSLGNPHDIKLAFNGVDKVELVKGKLQISTTVNQIIEQKPYAYQLINGVEKKVKCKFVLKDNILSFSFPKGYKKQYPLIIDPVLVFASYSGSTADNWGSTSTFDDAGNLYGGGVTFGLGYPTTLGAFDVNFNGGNGDYSVGTDITISKFSSDGSTLIYSTYLGGSENEYVHSLIVNPNNELYLMGTTSSNNYPVSTTAYSSVFNGGISYTGSTPNYLSGSDIIISKLNLDGSSLLASTYIGGTGNDGLNTSTNLKYNYADDHRGEILLNSSGDVFVASSTFSSDFPVTSGVFQSVHAGGQDGCVFKMDGNLSTLIWSSFIGGSSEDAAYSLQFDNLGNTLITGGTSSLNFPTTPGVINPNFIGGIDGFITRLNGNGTAILNSTYVGTLDYDQSYFVQLDNADNVYVVGQTEGVYPITPITVYSDSNSGQFIHKLSSDLSTTIFSTTFGTGTGEVDISLSAFLVNECNYILISGWGGYINRLHAGAPFSTTNGLPITVDAVQPITDGDDYYLMMLSENANDLLYATYFGGNASGDHVDGGTSRFDKKGVVYQAVCSSCYNQLTGVNPTNDFPTTSGAWSTTDNGPNCNLGVFKIDLSLLNADAGVYVTPYHCVGDTVHFQNLSNGGVSYVWDFADGNTSNLFEPEHVYTNGGNYTVMLIATDVISCITQDTAYVNVFISFPPVAVVNPVNPICKGDSIQLNVAGGLIYEWQPNYNILNNNTATPTVFPDTTTLYTVIVTDSCGTDTTEINVTVFQNNTSILPDTMICLGESVGLLASGGVSYLWQPNASLNNVNIANPIATPLTNTMYTVTITDVNNCAWDTAVTVSVDALVPIAVASPKDTICMGDTVEIFASGGANYTWSPANTLANPTDSLTTAYPTQNTNYIVEVTNGCGADYDTVFVQVKVVMASIITDTIVCAGDEVSLWVQGGSTYLWSPGSETTSVIQSIINVPSTFSVLVTDTIGCATSLAVTVDTLVKPTIEIGEDIEIAWGSQVQLNPSTNGVSYWWSPSEGLSCITCLNPVVKAKETSTYILTVQGDNDCYKTDTITIYYDGAIYLPNSFTPDGNGENDIFYAYGEDIVQLKFYIFDRWGEQIFFSDNLSKGWDGTYKGKLLPNDTYVWKVWYEDVLGISGNLRGKVTLVK